MYARRFRYIRYPKPRSSRCRTMNSDHGLQKGRSPRLAVARRVSILLAAVCVSGIAFADPYWAPRFEVSLSHGEQRALERAACEPLNVRMRTSIATRWES